MGLVVVLIFFVHLLYNQLQIIQYNKLFLLNETKHDWCKIYFNLLIFIHSCYHIHYIMVKFKITQEQTY